MTVSYIMALDTWSTCLESESQSAAPVKATAMLHASETVPFLMLQQVDAFNATLANGKPGS